MTVSQNGYESRNPNLIATYTVVRDVKLSLRKGDCSVVLLHFARWFDDNIEALTKIDCGGYNPRAIGGSKTDSNHASGTAEDLNWNKHVRGVKNTFTAAEQKKIRAQLKFYEGVIRWGGDYKHATIDDMHFEINEGPAEVARIAKKCLPKPPEKPFDPDAHVVVDGKLGPETIKKWQSVMGATVTGVLSPTFVKQVETRLYVVDHRISIDGHGIAQNGKRYREVGALQRYLKVPVDQIIDTPVSQTVMALQRRLNTGTF